MFTHWCLRPEFEWSFFIIYLFFIAFLLPGLKLAFDISERLYPASLSLPDRARHHRDDSVDQLTVDT